MEKINVEEIMEEIRRDIREKGYREENFDFTKVVSEGNLVESEKHFQMDELQIQLNNMVSFCNNPIYFPLQGNPIKVFIQRVIRRGVLFVIFSAFQFQNRFNASIMSFSRQVELFIRETSGLKKQVEDQQKQLEKCRREIRDLEERLNRVLDNNGGVGE